MAKTNFNCPSNSWNSGRPTEVVQYRDSSDPLEANAGTQVRTGRKWRVEEAVQDAEARLSHRRVVGVITRGQIGLGCFPSPQTQTISQKERRRLVQEEVKAVLEETRSCKAVGLRQQGAWMRRESVIDRKVT